MPAIFTTCIFGGRSHFLGPQLCPWIFAYILKATKLAEFTFQPKKIGEKVRKSQQQNFATNA